MHELLLKGECSSSISRETLMTMRKLFVPMEHEYIHHFPWSIITTPGFSKHLHTDDLRWSLDYYVLFFGTIPTSSISVYEYIINTYHLYIFPIYYSFLTVNTIILASEFQNFWLLKTILFSSPKVIKQVNLVVFLSVSVHFLCSKIYSRCSCYMKNTIFSS